MAALSDLGLWKQGIIDRLSGNDHSLMVPSANIPATDVPSDPRVSQLNLPVCRERSFALPLIKRSLLRARQMPNSIGDFLQVEFVAHFEPDGRRCYKPLIQCWALVR